MPGWEWRVFSVISMNTVACGRVVPEDFQIECGEQAGFERGRERGQDVAGEREPVDQGGVGGGRGGGLQGLALGSELLAFVVEVGEPGTDPGAHGGVGRVSGQLLQLEELGVLGGVDLPDAGGEGGDLLVALGGGVGVGGRELGGQQPGAFGSEHAG